MKKLISLLIFNLIFIQNLNASSYCSTQQTNIDTQNIHHLCQGILENTICKEVPKNKMKKCDELNQSLDSSWDYIQGCAKGALESVEDILDFIAEVMKWSWQAITGQKDWGAMSDKGMAFGESSLMYLKTEYYRSYERESEPFRETKAVVSMGEKISQLILTKINDYLAKEYEVFDQCLNKEARAQLTCKFLGTFFLPPAAALAFLKYGKRAFAEYRGLEKGAEDIKNLIPNKELELKGNHRNLVDRESLDKNYIHFQATTTAENTAWIERARKSHPGSFIEVENGALKRLNDQLGDKNLVTGLTNLHKEFLFEKIGLFIKKYPDLKISKYSDFKSSRFSFEPKLNASQWDELKKLINESNLEFGKKVKELNLHPKLKTEKSETWFSSGFGETADQAGVAARESRNVARLNNDHPIPTIDFKLIKAKVADHVASVEDKRFLLVTEFNKSEAGRKLLETIPGTDQKVFSREVFEALRKGDQQAISILDKKYGITLDQRQQETLLSYYHGVDKLAPGIWIPERVVANLDDAVAGGFSADFAGMGAANIEQVAKDLATHKGSVDELIASIRKGEEQVTGEFESKKSLFNNQVQATMEKLGEKSIVKCSGDDCVSLVRTSLNIKKKKEIIGDLMMKTSPSSMRLSFIPPGIPKALRSKIAVAGEMIEKELRKAVTNLSPKGIAPEKMKNVMLALDMPKGVKGDQVNLVIGIKGKATLTSQEIEILKQNFAESVRKLKGEIDYGDGVVPNYQPGQLIIVRK